MKKFTGNFTADATKALKGSQRLICRTAGEGEIYVTNGCTAYKMFPWEYSSGPSACARASACCLWPVCLCSSFGLRSVSRPAVHRLTAPGPPEGFYAPGLVSW